MGKALGIPQGPGRMGECPEGHVSVRAESWRTASVPQKRVWQSQQGWGWREN